MTSFAKHYWQFKKIIAEVVTFCEEPVTTICGHISKAGVAIYKRASYGENSKIIK
ncbi:MAG: hypothetical protein NTV89_18655 [Proteobacteria bacterium]|nr:hypothetical protein [Pseudomonadota bacterium]